MNLSDYSQKLSQAVKDASQWVERNSDLVRNEKEGLLRELRRAGRTFRACGRASERRMCAGVFGPSQAGKSYLISALARGESNELIAKFGSETRDFISEINPEGGKESTGLVTRFTLEEPKDLPPGYPVQTRLLSETDLVKILANAYYADCEHMEEAQSDIGATLSRLKSRAKEPGTGIDLDSLEELREYLAKDFRGKARVQELERSYWEEALSLGQRLDLEGRVQLYALIWDEVEEFTQLLRKLLLALQSLDFADRLFCGLDALIPRDSSIIDVATLKELNAGGDEIEVMASNGRKTRLPRPVITALTAELTIVMRDRPADYFEHTDLLDFPGYRSRYQLEDVRAELRKNPAMLQELFLRGKVAYLFQRYCAERELNSMLLCIGPGNQEVQDLPGVISDWVDTTHGHTPEEREGKLVSLFFILTKFDMEFEDKKGAPSLQSRWDNRLKASLLDFFGKQRDWPAQWTPGRGFDNMFLLRNPNFKFDSVLSFAGDVETGIRPERAEFVDKLKSAFIGSGLVADHFRDPARAWNEAMRLNDGGISYIRESLSPLCDPQIKERQLLENINSAREHIARRLRPFYKSDDREELRKQKVLLIRSLFKSLGNLEMVKRGMGQLLRGLTISDADVYALYPQAIRRFREREIEPAAPVPDTGPEDIDMEKIDLEDFNPFANVSEETAQPVAEEEDEASFYAAYIESKWVERLHQLADDADAQKFFLLPPQEFSALATELATGAARVGLRQTLTRRFRETAAYANTARENIAKKQAAIATSILNDFVDWLGFSPRKSGSQPLEVQLLNGKSAPVFLPHPEIQGVPVIPDKPASYAKVFYGDWLNALAGLIMANVNFDGEQTFNAAENLALGSIIRHLDKKAA